MNTTYKTTKEIAQDVRKELKEKFPTCKFSVTCDSNQITVALMNAPVSPFVDGKGGYEQLNHYYLDNYLEKNDRPRHSWENTRHLTPAAVKMFKEITKISNRQNWDRSEIQVDYFDVNYYFALHIGKWNQEFEVKK